MPCLFFVSLRRCRAVEVLSAVPPPLLPLPPFIGASSFLLRPLRAVCCISRSCPLTLRPKIRPFFSATLFRAFIVPLIHPLCEVSLGFSFVQDCWSSPSCLKLTSFLFLIIFHSRLSDIGLVFSAAYAETQDLGASPLEFSLWTSDRFPLFGSGSAQSLPDLRSSADSFPRNFSSLLSKSAPTLLAISSFSGRFFLRWHDIPLHMAHRSIFAFAFHLLVLLAFSTATHLPLPGTYLFASFFSEKSAPSCYEMPMRCPLFVTIDANRVKLLIFSSPCFPPPTGIPIRSIVRGRMWSCFREMYRGRWEESVFLFLVRRNFFPRSALRFRCQKARQLPP